MRSLYRKLPFAPHIAVLNPAPYQGTGLTVAIVFLAIFAAVHLRLTLPDLLRGV